jgi:hypothetical protein
VVGSLSLVRYGHFGNVWFDLVCFGFVNLVWFGLSWVGLIWFGLIFFRMDLVWPVRFGLV